MQSLPIVQRELLVLARRRATYWNRFSMGLTVSGLLIWMMTVFIKTQPPAMVGRQLFMVMVMVLFGSALFSGVKNASDSLCAERREGTLGFLFLTDLSGWDVVLGKLAATGMNAVYMLLASCPILALISLMGGIGLVEIAGSAVLLANTLFLSHCVGLLVSTLLRSERACASLTAGIMLALCAYPALIAAVVYLLTEKSMDAPPWPYLAPWYPFTKVGGGFMTGLKAWDLLTSVLWTQAFAWTCLSLAAWRAPRCWQEFGTQKASKEAKARTVSASGFLLRAKRLVPNPVFWLAMRKSHGHWILWLMLATAAGIWSYGIYRYGQDWRNPPAYAFTALVLHLIFKLWVASESGTMIYRDRQSGALELITGTSLPLTAIIHGQQRAIWKQMRGPLAVLLLFDAWVVVDGVHLLRRTSEEVTFWIASAAIFLGTFLLDLATLTWVSLWTSLNATKVNQGPSKAFFGVVGLPAGTYIGLFVLLAMNNFFGFGTGSADRVWILILFLLWPLSFTVWDVILIRRSRRLILQHLREKASERAPVSSDVLERFWKWCTARSGPEKHGWS